MSDLHITTAASSDQVRKVRLPRPPVYALDDTPLKIWPPNQSIRDIVVYNVAETLATPSFLSNRYGIIPSDEVFTDVMEFEVEAFAFADSSVASDGDGMEKLRVYSKKIGKWMLETAKSRGSAAIVSVSDQAPPSSLTTTEDAPAATEVDT